MKILLGFLVLYLVLPYFGLFTFTNHEENLYGGISDYFVISYSIHLIIIFTVIFSILYITKTDKKYNSRTILNDKLLNMVFNKSIIFLLIAIFIMLFIFGAINVVLGNSGRGELRVTLGFFGFLYNFFTMFLPAGIIVIASIYYQLSNRSKKFRIKLYFIYFLGLLIGVLTGFKFTAILILSAGLVQMSDSIRVKSLILIGLLFLGLTVFSAFYFMGLDGFTALNYVFARATSVACEGTVGVWNLYPNGAEDAWMALLYSVGNKLASLLTGYQVTDVEFLKVNITRLIGYLTYPKASEALSGAFNLTVTNFGEGIYYFGKYYYFIFSILTGLILGFTIRYFFITKTANHILTNTMISVYMMITVLPWLMGGVIGNLFGIPTFIYMLLLYGSLKIITSKLSYRRLRNEDTIYNRQLSTRSKCTSD